LSIIPLERQKTTYVLTDKRAVIVSGLFKQKAKSFDLKTMNFTALTKLLKGKATIIFGQVNPEQYGAADPERKRAEINTWKRFGYRLELFEVGASNEPSGGSPKRLELGRFEFIEDPRTVYDMLREMVPIMAPAPAPEIEQPKITSFVEGIVKRPGTIVFIIDVSDSMGGDKLNQAKEGLIAALNMTDNNLVGLISFNSEIVDSVPLLPLSQNRQHLSEKIRRMSTNGNTALYDALKAGIKMTEPALCGEKDICTLVVLTDGQANVGKTCVHDIIRMTTRDGRTIRRYSGFREDAADSEGRYVSKQDIKGTGLAMATKHPVQIFFIGIGTDADMEIGRILAEATGAESERGVELLSGSTVQRVRRVRDVDLARVLEEFKYF
jgi:hypothetical protein